MSDQHQRYPGYVRGGTMVGGTLRPDNDTVFEDVTFDHVTIDLSQCAGVRFLTCRFIACPGLPFSFESHADGVRMARAEG